MVERDYSAPVNQLFDIEDEILIRGDWPDYCGKFGFKPDHIPELLQCIMDQSLHDQVAPLHARRVLGQLKAVEAVPQLLLLCTDLDDDWACEEGPIIIGRIGTEAIPALKGFVLNSEVDELARVIGIMSFEQIALQHPDAQADVIEDLALLLSQHASHPPTLNGFIISTLCELKAVDLAPLIKRVYQSHNVDLSIVGDWREVQVELGLKRRKDVPLRAFRRDQVKKRVAFYGAELNDAIKQPPRNNTQGFGQDTAKSKKKKPRKK